MTIHTRPAQIVAPTPVTLEGLLSYSYSLNLPANGVKEPLFPDAWSLGPAGVPGLQNMAGLNTICPRPTKAMIKIETAVNLGCPLLFFQDEGTQANPVEFVPGDGFTDWLSYQWLDTAQPYCISTKTPTIGGTDASTVTAAEADPGNLTTGIDVSSEEKIAFAIGAQMTNVAAFSYRVWGLVSATLDVAGNPMGWANLYEATASGPVGGTIKIEQDYVRLFVQIASVTPAGAGAFSITRTFSTDGDTNSSPTVVCTAWWERE